MDYAAAKEREALGSILVADNEREFANPENEDSKLGEAVIFAAQPSPAATRQSGRVRRIRIRDRADSWPANDAVGDVGLHDPPHRTEAENKSRCGPFGAPGIRPCGLGIERWAGTRVSKFAKAASIPSDRSGIRRQWIFDLKPFGLSRVQFN
jgi:hypothetical protein